MLATRSTRVKLHVLSHQWHICTSIRQSSTSARFPRNPSFHPFFTKARPKSSVLNWRYVWTLPVAGGVAVALAPQKPLLLTAIFASPKLIPCRQSNTQDESQLMIMSPDEEDRTILSRLYSLIEKLLEPLFTARRFIHLFCIFVPVIVSSPMLLIGQSDQDHQGDGWGALWWYDQLTLAMQRAGPTFIKVCFP